jgi:hypothetical protein
VNKLLVECRFAPCSQTSDRIVRDGLETIYAGQLFRESFAPDCWISGRRPATFQLSHNGDAVGEVTAVINHRVWHIASMVVDDTPMVRERVRRGARVSLDARSIKRDEDSDLRLVRHTLAKLNHIALVNPGQVQGHLGAVITYVREMKPAKREHPARAASPRRAASMSDAELWARIRPQVLKSPKGTKILHPDTGEFLGTVC